MLKKVGAINVKQTLAITNKGGWYQCEIYSG